MPPAPFTTRNICAVCVDKDHNLWFGNGCKDLVPTHEPMDWPDEGAQGPDEQRGPADRRPRHAHPRRALQLTHFNA